MMSVQYAVFLDRKKDGNEPRCCVTVEKFGRTWPAKSAQLMLAIHGPDQDATEFLNRKQFEELVVNARAVMGWEKPR